MLTDAEADDMAADNYRDFVMDDPLYYMGGVENALDYIDVDHFQDMMESEAEYRVDDMSNDELIEEGLDRDIIIFPDNFELLSYVKEDAISELLESHPEYSELSEDELLAKAGEEGIVDLEDRENYELLNERETLDQIRSELIAQYQSDYDDPIEWYIDMFGRQDLEEYVTNNTDLIDVDRYVDDIIRYGYDSREYYIGDGSSEIDLGNGYYAFRYE